MFHKIAIIDDVNLTKESRVLIQKFSRSKIKWHKKDPATFYNVIDRIADADAALVSWRTKIDEKVLEKCPNLKYIGICATAFSNPEESNVNIRHAKRFNITVTNVKHYGDEATAEFIFQQLLTLVRGQKHPRWKSEPHELFGKSIGIIGLGAVGKQVAHLALGFGMNLFYDSRTRKPEWEKKGLKYMAYRLLLQRCDIVSLHTPKGTKIMGKDEFELMGPGTIFVNTTLGKSFNEKIFLDWISQKDRFAIMDASTHPDFYEKFSKLKNVIFPNVIAGRTYESKFRLSQKVVDNLNSFSAGKPINVIRL